MLSLCVFNVEAGQCIFVYYPNRDPNYCALIDCGCDKRVIKFIKEYLPKDSGGNIFLRNFTLTNYDEDHFRGICELKKNIAIETICFSKNLASDEIKSLKEDETEALKRLLEIKDGAGGFVSESDWKPPYGKFVYSLNKDELEKWRAENATNNLSQMVFLEYNGFVICIPGDLEREMGKNSSKTRSNRQVKRNKIVHSFASWKRERLL